MKEQENTPALKRMPDRPSEGKKGSGYYGKGNCRYGRHQSWNLLPAL